MMPTLIALFVFALSGLGLTAWLRRGQMARPAETSDTRSAAELSTLRWREFAKLVLQALHARGYRPAAEEGLPADGIPTDGSDIVLERNGSRTLLSCKYGSASVVGVQALMGLAQSATLRGAQDVIVVTPGRFDEEATRIARQQNIELIDGQSLWPEVRPYVAAPMSSAAASRAAASPAQRRTALAWGAAAVIGLLAWMLAQGMQSTAVDDDALPPLPARVAHTAASGAAAESKKDSAPVPTDPAALEQRRREAASAISTVFGVDRALWSTQSTLLVYLSSEDADPTTDLCPLLERYPELAASRVQLQPPAGSQKPVRFKQCRTY